MLGLYYPSPIMGAIIGGTLINSLGAFVPFDKGISGVIVFFALLLYVFDSLGLYLMRKKCLLHHDTILFVKSY